MRKTKQIILIVNTLLIFGTKANAQAFEENKNYFSLSYGFKLVNPSTFLTEVVGDISSDIKIANFNPIGLKYEHALTENIGVGVSMGYSSFDLSTVVTVDDGTTVQKYNHSINGSKFTASARMNLHFGDHDIIDPYIGFGLGYKNRSIKYTSNDPSKKTGLVLPILTPLSFEATFGTRFMFHKNVGAFVEIGIGHGFLQGGLVGKF